MPDTGDLYERTFPTSKGPVDFLAEIIVDGDTLTLQDVVVFGRGSSNLSGLAKEAYAARTQLIDEFRLMGFRTLRITARRVSGSSSANPGHAVDLTVDLTR